MPLVPRNNLAYYDQWAAQWWQPAATAAPLNQLNPLRFQFFDRYQPSWHGLRVLDLGCGGGFTCEFLARRGAVVTGLDPSAACLEAARAHAVETGLRVDYCQGHGEQLPFAPATFDAVVCVDVLEHVADPALVIQSASRVLKPGGKLFFDTLNRTWQSRLVMIWLLEYGVRRIPLGVHDWHKFITPAELTDMLTQQGLAVGAIAGFNLFGEGMLGKWQRLQQYWRSGQLAVEFGSDRIMYIGVAIRN